jgi:uncharacterized protein YciI
VCQRLHLCVICVPAQEAVYPPQGRATKLSTLNLLPNRGNHLCSGALIGPKHVLTTASCIYKFKNSRDAASWDHEADFSYSGLTVNIAGDSMLDAGSGFGDGNVVNIHVHPSAAFDMEVLREGCVDVPCAQGCMVVFFVRVWWRCRRFGACRYVFMCARVWWRCRRFGACMYLLMYVFCVWRGSAAAYMRS